VFTSNESERKHEQQEMKIFYGLKSVIVFENTIELTNTFAYISPKYLGPKA